VTTDRKDVQDFDAGKEAADRWFGTGGAAVMLSEEQLAKLPVNLDRYINHAGELDHVDDHRDAPTDAYVALTGDLDFRSREVPRRFWEKVLGADPAGLSEGFFLGFISGVAAHVY
jgi:hypothetical protein